MKLTTTRAVDLFGSDEARDKLYVTAWLMVDWDRAGAAAVMQVLAELEQAEREAEQLKVELADLRATIATQEPLPVREKPRLVADGVDYLGVPVEVDERLPEGVVLLVREGA